MTCFVYQPRSGFRAGHGGPPSRAAHLECEAAEWPWTPKLLVSGHQLGAAGSGLGLGEAEGGNKETTGSSAFISPGYSQLQVSNLISAASCFLRCLAVPRHPLTCHQPREKGRVGGRMGVGAPPVWVPHLHPRRHTRHSPAPAGPAAVHLGCSLQGRWARPAAGRGG